jgi:hypothetical protein
MQTDPLPIVAFSYQVTVKMLLLLALSYMLLEAA